MANLQRVGHWLNQGSDWAGRRLALAVAFAALLFAVAQAGTPCANAATCSVGADEQFAGTAQFTTEQTPDGTAYEIGRNDDAINRLFLNAPAGSTIELSIAGTEQFEVSATSTRIVSADLVFGATASQIVPGATSLSLRNNADSADNVLVSDAGLVTLRNGLVLGAGVATVAGNYEVRRNADATNLLQLNVPTGASFELSVQDTTEFTLSATAANFQDNSITTTGGGSLTGTWSNLGSVTTIDINGGTFDGGTIGGAVAGAITGTTITANTGFMPDANDGAYLGQSGTAFSDLFLASGAVINFAAGNAALTHSSGVLTVSTGDLRVTTAGTNAASAVTVGGTQTLTNKTLSNWVTSGTITGTATFSGAVQMNGTTVSMNPGSGAAPSFTMTATAPQTNAIFTMRGADTDPAAARIDVGTGAGGTQGRFILETARGSSQTITAMPAYDSALTTVGGRGLHLGTNSTLRVSIDSAGFITLGATTGNEVTSRHVYDSGTYTLGSTRSSFYAYETAPTIATTASNFGLTDIVAGFRAGTFTKTNSGTLAHVTGAYFAAQTVGTDNAQITLANGVTAPAAAADQIRIWGADIAAGDARVGIQTESGGAIYLGGNTMRAALPAAAAATNVSLNASNELQQDTSSARFKDAIRPLELDTALIYQLEPRTFDWNSLSATPGIVGHGPIAEAAYEVSPFFANLNADQEPWSINWQTINVAMLVEIQKQQAVIADLQARVAALEGSGQ